MQTLTLGMIIVTYFLPKHVPQIMGYMKYVKSVY